MRTLAALLPFTAILSHQLNSFVDGKSVDLLPDCAEKASKGECVKDPKFMIENCAASCDAQPGVRKVQVERVDVDKGEPSFFDLSAKDAKGNTVNFRQFDGYITLVVTVPRYCGVTERYYKALDHFHDVWPWSVEVIAFPYKKSNDSADPDECTAHKEADLSEHRKIRVMKPVNVNGLYTHPVIRYLKGVMKVDQDGLEENDATFFLINPDGSQIELHEKSKPEYIKDYIKQHLEQDL